jgi:hypothetical protein
MSNRTAFQYSQFHRKTQAVRIGFLVRPGDASDLQKAAAFCCLLWGGLYNPVIPVTCETDAAMLYKRLR